MPIWGGKKKIPDTLPAGGKLSEYGGPRAAVQYRLWLTPYGGKRFYVADPEFAGITIAWRKAQQDLEYYTDIELPVAVVWDQGIRSYREVILDTLMPKIMPAKAPQEKKVEEQKREATLEEEERRRIQEYMAQATLTAPAETVKTGKVKGKGAAAQFVPETISILQKEEAEEAAQTARFLRAREKAGANEPVDEEPNPKKPVTLLPKKGQLIQAFTVKEMTDDIGRFTYPWIRVDSVRQNDFVASDWRGGVYVVPRGQVKAIAAGRNPMRRNLTPRNTPWPDRPYRGRTSFNLPEAVGMKNKHVLMLTGALVAGVIGLMWYASWKSRQVPP